MIKALEAGSAVKSGTLDVIATCPLTTTGTAAGTPVVLKIVSVTAATTTTAAPSTTVVTTTTTLPRDDSEVSISKSELMPGEGFTLAGDGWMPGSTVDFELHSDPVSLGSAEVDDEGAFSADLQIPTDVEVGAHTLTVPGTDAEGNARTESVPVTLVTGPVVTIEPQLTTTTTVAPGGSGGGGALPRTGASTAALAFFGLTMLAGGLLLARRRRATY